MPSIRITSPRELGLAKGMKFWPDRNHPRSFKIDHIEIRTCPNPDMVEVRLYDSPEGDVREIFYCKLGRSAIQRIIPKHLGRAGLKS